MLMRKLVPHFMPSWDDYYIHCMPQSFCKVCFMYKSTVISMSTNQRIMISLDYMEHIVVTFLFMHEHQAKSILLCLKFERPITFKIMLAL